MRSHPISARRRFHGCSTVCRQAVSSSFHSPSGVLFTFPSRYWFTIGRQEYLALDSGLPGFPHERPSTWYSGGRSGGRLLRLRGYHPLWPAIPGQVRLTNDFVTPSGSGRIPTSTPTTPAPKRLPPITRNEFGLFPFRSPLLRE